MVLATSAIAFGPTQTQSFEMLAHQSCCETWAQSLVSRLMFPATRPPTPRRSGLSRFVARIGALKRQAPPASHDRARPDSSQQIWCATQHGGTRAYPIDLYVAFRSLLCVATAYQGLHKVDPYETFAAEPKASLRELFFANKFFRYVTR